MAKRMLIDATHPEETRVAVISGNRLEEFDFESARKKQIKGNVYLAKVTRVEPSLQACFVEYGGNRHGFLAFNEIHPDYYRIPVADREALNRMVAEAMAAQDDDEEEDRRPRWRRRGRRQRGDSDEYASSSGSEEPYPANEAAGHAPGPGDGADDATSEREPAPAALDTAPPERAETAPIDESANEREGGREPAPAAEEDAHRSHATYAMDMPERFEREDGSGSVDDPAASAGASLDAPPSATPELGEAPSQRDEPAEDSAPAAEADAAAAEEVVETVGGDELEDIRRRHRIWNRRYKIQEVVRKRQILLVQVAKEERGNKGAALTTYISLAGRYCVLMPNTPRGGGISRKITSQLDRKRLKDIVGELEVPDGMAVIVRTAGMERSKPELRRDLDFLLGTWDEIREKALSSTAPALIYEEANLIKRAVRDLYSKDVEEIIVDGAEGFAAARSFMKLLMPNHVKKVVEYTDKQIPLFHRYQVESQIDNMHSPSVQLRSGGYIVLNPTEALVSIDVNSGRSTRERNIEETATRTNLEAADEIARQLRLRDLAGLIVIDFIDMEEGRNRHAVERRLKEALRHDRARIQVGRISPFGLLEMSRQRLRPSLVEASMMQCPHCVGAGYVRSTESMALTVLRAVEEEGLRQRSAEITVAVPTAVALYIFNQKRGALSEIEARHDFHVILQPDDGIGLSTYRIVRSVAKAAESRQERASEPEVARAAPSADHRVERLAEEPAAAGNGAEEQAEAEPSPEAAPTQPFGEDEARESGSEKRGRRRGRRGGRRRRGRGREDEAPSENGADEGPVESTLGPFGADAEATPEVAPAGEPMTGPRSRSEPSVSEQEPPTRQIGSEAPAAPPSYTPAPFEPHEADVRTEEPPTTEGEAPSPPAPPPPTEPPAPPRRGWWNLRRS